jgi:hypothetical protein
MPLGGIYRTRTMSRKMYSTLGGGGAGVPKLFPRTILMMRASPSS